MRSINYNPMLMMLWNLSPNIACIGNFGMWDIDESNLISRAKEINANGKLKLNILNMVSFKEFSEAILTFEAIDIESLSNDADYYTNYILNKNDVDQKNIFKNIKSLLNVKQVVIKDTFSINGEPINKVALDSVFGQENVFIIKSSNNQSNIDRLKSLLNDGHVKNYNAETGISYSFRGNVVKGNQLGRTIGYPTANVVTEYNLPIKDGVYYTSVKLPNDDKIYPAMSCYWTNNKNQKVIETNIFNFNKDIYGWNIEIFFNDWIRDMKPAKNVEEVKAMLESDKNAIENKYIGD